MRADRTIKRKFYTPTPVWVIILIIFSLLVALLVALAIRKTDEIGLPGCQSCADATRNRRRIRWGTGIASLVVLIGAGTTGNDALLLLFFIVVLAWLMSFSTLLDSMGAVTGRLYGPWLQLKGVHPAFVAAMRPNPAWQQQAQQLYQAQPQYAAAPPYAAAPQYGGSQCAVPPSGWQPPRG